jgi:site-specific DNA-adenine methylase
MARSPKIPGFAYPGGKVRLRKWLVSMMPKSGRTYCEPFAGRGNVFWLAARVLRFEKWWLNDIWTKPFFDAILEADLSEIPIRLTKDATRSIRERLEGESATVLDHVLSPCIFYSGGTGGGIATSATSILKRNMAAFRKQIENARLILIQRKPKITAFDWIDVAFGQLNEQDFVYLDPPYIGADCGYVVDTVDHEALAATLLDAKFKWLLSGYDSDIYRNTIGAPNARMSVPVTTAHGKRCLVKTECVWRNY